MGFSANIPRISSTKYYNRNVKILWIDKKINETKKWLQDLTSAPGGGGGGGSSSSMSSSSSNSSMGGSSSSSTTRRRRVT
jgi:hypothetical protein